MEGWVKLWRKSLAKGWLKNHKLWVFWCWCLMKASHREYDLIVGDDKRGYQEVHLMPGQFIFGRKQAAKELGMSERSIRTCLNFGKKAQNLTSRTTNRFSVITIVNWHTYQGEQIQNDQQNDQQATSRRPRTRSNKKKSTNDHSDNGLMERFETFWEVYPKKKSKGQARKAWLKMKPSEQLLTDMLNAIERAKTSVEWRKDNGQYVPYPSTWLNAEGWLDEYKPQKGKWDDIPTV